jgi:hypothetical protein
MINKPTPATSGGNASGISSIVFSRFLPRKSYRARAYAAGTDTIIHMSVDIADVIRLNLIANSISPETRLVRMASGVV